MPAPETVPTILWFRHALRLDDNRLFHAAAELRGPLRLVWILPSRLARISSFGLPRIGPHRIRALSHALAGFRRDLERVGLKLDLLAGNPAVLIPGLIAEFGAGKGGGQLVTESLPFPEEEAELAQVRSVLPADWSTVLVEQAPLIEPESLGFDPGAVRGSFTGFRKRVERTLHLRDPIPPPAGMGSRSAAHSADSGPDTGAIGSWIGAELAAIAAAAGEDLDALGPYFQSGIADPRSAMPDRWDESAARARLADYIHARRLVRRYKQTRNGLLGADYSSKLSAFLALGTLSPRRIMAELRSHEREHGANESTYWLFFELLWRDYFYYLLRNHGSALFQSRGLKPVSPPWQIQPEVIRDWMTGRTGEAFIDANMHELLATGYMSNRGRQNVASYLARDLGQHWRVGAEWFETMLVDYDPASNYGNWTYNTGVGTDPREDRYFDPRAQAEKYDSEKRYRLGWADPGTAPVDPLALTVRVPADA